MLKYDMPKFYGRIRPYEIGHTKIKKKSIKIGSPDPYLVSILKHKFLDGNYLGKVATLSV